MLGGTGLNRRTTILVIGGLILVVVVWLSLWLMELEPGSIEKARMISLWDQAREKELEAGNRDTLIYVRLLAGDRQAQPWMRNTAEYLVYSYAALPGSSQPVRRTYPLEAYRRAQFDPKQRKFILFLEPTSSARSVSSEIKPSKRTLTEP